MSRVFYSKPGYRTLEPVPGRLHHFLITDHLGAERAVALQAGAEGDSQCVVVCEQRSWARLAQATPIAPHALPEYLAEQLRGLPAPTQFYLFGRESFIWRVYAMLETLHVPRAQCAVECCGPLERDVFCVHCRHTTSEVSHSPVQCGGCGRLLHVYDHFSRRLGCYMGFQVNAECESDIPAREALR